LDLCLEAMAAMVEALVFDASAARAAAEGGYAQATDIADYLVAKGLSFRDAHRLTGKLVAMLAEKDRPLSDASIEELACVSPLFGDDYYEVVDLDRVVAAKISPGGTAPERVAEQLAMAHRIAKSPQH
jgi:argininosuccinate lyase